MLAALVAGFASTSPLALAAKAPAKPAPKKPAAKKPAAPARPPVLGTQQLKGDQAQIGVTYTLGKDDPINITVTGVRYSADRITIGQHRYVPKAAEKLMVIDLVFHNPQKQERLVRYDAVMLTAIDSKDVNHEGAAELGVPETNESLSVLLKPGQKRTAFTYVVVPAAHSIPKLIIKSHDDLVLRYDLRGKIKPLAPPFKDPKDTSGTIALETVPAALNAPFQIGYADDTTWDLEIEKVAFVEGALGEWEPDEENRLLVMTAKVTNQNAQKWLFRYDSVLPTVVTTDDERIDATMEMLHATANRSIGHNLEKGASGRFRMFFQMPKDAKVKTLLIRQQEESRTYAIDISSVQ